MRAGSAHGGHGGAGIAWLDISAGRGAFSITQARLDRARLVTS